MTNGFVPPAVTIMAATSRLIDLQHPRGANVYIPAPGPKGGTYTGIALLVLDILHNLERERGTGYVTITELYGFVRQLASDVLLEDLEYVLLSLSKEREICYSTPDEETCTLNYGYVRDKTKIVDLADSRAQVRITDTASLFLRICENEISWLYDESDAHKIITALDNNKFGDIPTICRNISLDLAKKARELTDLIEHPTREEQGAILVADGPAINENLKKTKETIQSALRIILEQSTMDAFNQWAGRAKAGFELGNLQTELEVLLQTAEVVSRRFIEFLDIAQQRKDIVPSYHQFLDMAERLVFRCDSGSVQRLEHLMRGVMPADIPTRWFDPSLVPGTIDLYDLLDNPEEDAPPKSFNVTDSESPAVKHFMSFIEKNREAIYERLESGPMPFSEFLTSTDFVLAEDDTALDFLGVYVSPHALDSPEPSTQRIIVGFPQREFRMKNDGSLIISSDPLIMLEKQGV